MNTHQHASLASREPWSWNPSSHAGSNATLQNQQMLDQLKNQQQQKLRRQQQQQQQQQLQQRRWFNSDMNKKRISGFRGPTMPPRPMSSSSWTAVSILVMVQGAIILLQHQQHREERQTNDPDRKNSSKSILSKTNSQRFSSSKHLPPLQLTSTTEVDVLVEAPKGKKPWSMHGLLPSIPVPALQQNPTVASSSSSTMKLFPHLAELVDNRAYMESATEVVDDGTGTSQSGRSKGGFYLHNLFRSPASSSTNEEKQQKQQPRSVDKKSSLVKRSLTRRRSLMIARELEKAAEEEASLETKYKVHWRRPLGEGTFGAVYSATDRTTGRSVAVKKIYKQCTDQVSFQNEIGALLEIRKHGGHPNLCGLHGAFADHDPDGHFYLILDLIAGGELFNHLCEQGPYSEADAARLIREVASAMNFMHGLGLVHGDLKPENLMLSTRGKASSVVKVVDFGCAQRFDLPKEESKLDQSKPFLWMGSKPNDNATNNEKSTESKMSTGGRATALTPAYSSPEVLKQKREQAELSEDDDDDSSVPLDPSFDMWALGVILYILLTATHPFDLHGNATDEEIEASIVSGERPPLGQSELTEHLSADAVQVIELLLQWNPNDRLTAHQLLEHRWVRGETARTHKIADSDKRLSSYRAFQTKLQAKAFADMVALSSGPDVDADNQDETTTAIRENKKIMKPKTSGSFSKESSQGGLDGSNRTVSGRIGNRAISTNDGAVVSAPSDNNAMMRTSIIERAFQKFAPDHRGYIPAKELRKLSGEDNAELVGDLSLSGFSDILSEHMKNKYYPKGHVIYNEGEIGNAMFFLNSGSIEISTKDGYRAERKSGAFFGEGALLNPSKTRSASIKCLTPIHAIEISREYFDKYIATEQGVKLNLREKDKSRKRQRAKTLLQLQKNLEAREYKKGEYLFKKGEQGNHLFIVEEGTVVLSTGDQEITTVNKGEMTGEHSFVFRRPRNVDARCTDNICKVLVMKAPDFQRLLDSHPYVKESIREICLRREFQKAFCARARQPFPKTEAALREAFTMVDRGKTNTLELDEIRELLRDFDSNYSDQDIKDILNSLDLEKTGHVDWPEFQRIFGMGTEKNQSNGNHQRSNNKGLKRKKWKR